MTFVIHFVVCLCLLIIQTTFFPAVSLLNSFYDLCIPFVIFLGLMRPFRESVLTVLLLGFFIDNLSGSPLFLYVTVYFWLVISVQMILKLAQINTHLRLTALIIFGVLFENVFLTGYLILAEPYMRITYSQFSSLLLQLFWAGLTGSLMVKFFEYFYKGIVERIAKIIIAHTDQTSSQALDS